MGKLGLRLLCLTSILLCFCSCGSGEENLNTETGEDYEILSEEESVTMSEPETEIPKEETQNVEKDEESKADAGKLKGYMNLVKNFNMEGYANPEVIDEPLKHAEELIDSGTATQEEYDMALQKLKEAFGRLHDGSGFPDPGRLTQNGSYPDAFTFFDGTVVVTPEDWSKRTEELKELYQYYMYGVIRDGEGETLSCTYAGTNATVTVANGDNKGSFSFQIYTPDENKVPMPEEGWPVLMAMGWFFQVEYANERGYAVIVYDYNTVASDDMTRKGAFYDVYPYGDTWEEQTGALAAWGWGASKILDALEQELGEAYHIDWKNNILTGVSRCGKATAVAGVYDPRIKIAVPTCSGAGGMAMFRYNSEGETYDLSSIGASSAYKLGQNEPLSSLQSGAERHWFNDNFCKFTSVNAFPFDQHLLASLYAREDQYLFIISSYIYEDWTNPPAMWETYKEAKQIFTKLGMEDHIVFQIHKEGHAVIDEDVVKILDYADKHFYGKEVETDFSKMDTCLFETE